MKIGVMSDSEQMMINQFFAAARDPHPVDSFEPSFLQTSEIPDSLVALIESSLQNAKGKLLGLLQNEQNSTITHKAHGEFQFDCSLHGDDSRRPSNHTHAQRACHHIHPHIHTTLSHFHTSAHPHIQTPTRPHTPFRHPRQPAPFSSQSSNNCVSMTSCSKQKAKMQKHKQKMRTQQRKQKVKILERKQKKSKERA